MSDYRVDIKVRNNIILRKLKEHGYETIGEFCRINNIAPTTLSKVIAMTRSPLKVGGDFIDQIKFLADKLNCSPEDLFCESQMRTILETNKRHVEVSEAEARYLLDQSNCENSLEDMVDRKLLEDGIETAINKLPGRLSKIIKMRYGLGEYTDKHELEEVAKEFDVTRERIRQLEKKAMRILKDVNKFPELRQLM